MSRRTSGAPALDRRERIHRMRARSWVLQILYLWESVGSQTSLSDAAEAVFRTRRVSPERLQLIRERIESLERHLDEIDLVVGDAMEHWRLERLSRVDRAILRIATSEILFPTDVPPRVAIQEGIRLAGQYGGEDSPRFVNGVLDAIYKGRSGLDARS